MGWKDSGTALGKLALGSPGGKEMVLDLSRDLFHLPGLWGWEGRSRLTLYVHFLPTTVAWVLGTNAHSRYWRQARPWGVAEGSMGTSEGDSWGSWTIRNKGRAEGTGTYTRPSVLAQNRSNEPVPLEQGLPQAQHCSPAARPPLSGSTGGSGLVPRARWGCAGARSHGSFALLKASRELLPHSHQPPVAPRLPGACQLPASGDRAD